jgi:hypothetical protein
MLIKKEERIYNLEKLRDKLLLQWADCENEFYKMSLSERIDNLENELDELTAEQE